MYVEQKKSVDNLEHNQSGWRIFLQRLQRQEAALLQETPKSTSINVAVQRQTVGFHGAVFVSPISRGRDRLGETGLGLEEVESALLPREL